jgi:TPR repeat protein
MLWVPVNVSGQDASPSFCPCDPEMVGVYRRAAEGGLAAAQSRLGALYEYGEGVPQDYVLAYMWSNLGAAQGNESAQSNKDAVGRLMTREQIAEAQRLSREWLEAHPPGGN